MTHEEMLAIAREAGCVEPSHPFNPWSVSQEALKRFAALVITAERERCAKVCEEISNSMYWLNNKKEIAEDCAAAIRKGE